ncbi:MAG: SpoIID/LytB domain-containing protein [Candidatus Binatia bacterium]
MSRWRAAIRAAVVAGALVATAAAPLAHAREPGGRADLRWLDGRVTGALSRLPVAQATVTVTARLLRTRADGALSLAPLSAPGVPVASAMTGAEGRFHLAVPLASDSVYVKVDVSAPGYRPAANTLVRLESNAAVSFALVPLDLDPESKERLQSEHASAKARLYGELQTTIGPRVYPRSGAPPAPSTTATGSEYPVPEAVFVVELQGSMFTGFMDFDEYIAGVVAAEMGDTFPFEALKVQAVASRTFALDRFERSGTASGGQAYTAFFSMLGESHLAARNTTGGVLIHDDAPPTAFFSARCNGDLTLDSEDGLSCIPNGCGNPCTVGGLLPGAEPLPYARSRQCSGHVSCSLTSEPCCSVIADGRTQNIFGHGVGMCQRGTQEFACRDGIGFAEILTGFYTGVVIANRPGVATTARVATTSGLNARAEPCDANRVVVAANTPGTVIDGPRIEHCPQLGSCAGGSGTYWTWWQVDFDDGTTGRWVVEDFLERIAAPVAIEPVCSAPLSAMSPPRISDCLFILRTAVGTAICDPACTCAPGGSLPPSANDALICLGSSIELALPLACPC